MPIALRPFPRITDVKSLFRLFPSVDDIADPQQPDSVDSETGAVHYRFFRDCELVPFIDTSDRFQSLDAWYLSDASLLAYAAAPLAAETASAIHDAEQSVAKVIAPPLSRLFAALQRRDHVTRPVALRVIVRSSPLAGPANELPDPIQCYVADDGVVGIVAFRGTLPTSLPNWLTDFEPKLVPLRAGGSDAGANVHEGFRAAAQALLEDGPGGNDPGLRSYLAQRFGAHKDLKLWFTGHSLGAALATLCAYEIGNVQALYTYGSPRVGDARFAELFSQADIPHYRFVHHHDVVPHVPIPFPPLFAYEHVGDLKYIEYADEAAVQSDTPAPVPAKLYESPTRWSQVKGIFADAAAWFLDEVGRLKIGFLAKRFDLLTDHAPLYYSNLLWNGFVKQRERLLGSVAPAAAGGAPGQPPAK